MGYLALQKKNVLLQIATLKGFFCPFKKKLLRARIESVFIISIYGNDTLRRTLSHRQSPFGDGTLRGIPVKAKTNGVLTWAYLKKKKAK
jgi:hypothetical protein